MSGDELEEKASDDEVVIIERPPPQWYEFMRLSDNVEVPLTKEVALAKRYLVVEKELPTEYVDNSILDAYHSGVIRNVNVFRDNCFRQFQLKDYLKKKKPGIPFKSKKVGYVRKKQKSSQGASTSQTRKHD